MLRFVSLGIELLTSLAVLVPAYFLFRFFGGKAMAVKRKALLFLFVLWGLAIFSITGLPNLHFHTFDLNLNLIPFRGLIEAPVQYVLNIILFLPIGFMAALLWENFRNMKNIFLLGLGLSLFIELAQIFTFRATDIDDLIANTFGSVLGYLLTTPFQKKKQSAVITSTVSIEEYILFGTVLLGTLLIQPLLSDFLWWLALPIVF